MDCLLPLSSLPLGRAVSRVLVGMRQSSSIQSDRLDTEQAAQAEESDLRTARDMKTDVQGTLVHLACTCRSYVELLDMTRSCVLHRSETAFGAEEST